MLDRLKQPPALRVVGAANGGLKLVRGDMYFDANTATRLFGALGFARERGGAATSLTAASVGVGVVELLAKKDSLPHRIARDEAALDEAKARSH
jgi:hypothetical protein